LSAALLPFSVFERGLELLREAEALAAVLDDARRLGWVSGALSTYFRRMGAYAQAIGTAPRALALATASGDVVRQALANQRLGMAYYAQGDYRRAIDCFGQTVASLDGAWRHERLGEFFLPAVLSRTWLAVCQAELGAFAEGHAFGEEGLRIAEAVGHPASLMRAYDGIGLLCLRQGDLPSALPLLERAVAICQDAELLAYFPWVAASLGAAYTLAGRVADAVPLLTREIERAMGVDQVFCYLSLGETQMLAYRLEAAHVLAEQALAHARTRQERGNQAYALRLLGDIAARREPPESESAEAYYCQALALAEELGMRPLQAHCHLGLGTLYVQTGRLEPARAALTAAVALYRDMEMTFWLPQAEAALAQVEG